MPSSVSKRNATASARLRAADRATTKPKRHRASAREEFKTSMLNIRVRDDVKREAIATLAEIGISLPEAVRVFLGRVVRERAFPFELESPNAETVEAIEESRSSQQKRYTSAEEMFHDLEKGGS